MDYNKVWDYFDEAWCINLDHRTDRWENVQKEFSKVGLLDKIQRFSAIKHDKGTIGLILSNLKLIEMAKEKKLKNILIFEDDVHFINDTLTILEKSIEQIENLKWWLFYLGANTHTPLQLISKLKPNILQLQNAFATQSVAYSNLTYDLFIKQFSKFENLNTIESSDFIDVWLCNNFQKKNLCLVTNPIITTQSTSYSDIEKRNVNYNFMEQRFHENTSHIKI